MGDDLCKIAALSFVKAGCLLFVIAQAPYQRAYPSEEEGLKGVFSSFSCANALCRLEILLMQDCVLTWLLYMFLSGYDTCTCS
jgi:hypothetical protein